MKPREQIKKIRSSSSIAERLILAAGRDVGAEFDDVIQAADLYYPHGDISSKSDPDEKVWMEFHMRILEAIRKRESDLFKKLGKALDRRKQERTPDKFRSAILWFWLHSEKRTTARRMTDYIRSKGIIVEENTVRRECKKLNIVLMPDTIGRPRKKV